ncbi:MAG: hypothetical protein IT223_10540, partial [Crocinitomicaceae bacterium]|nr:hypothetical protein [Crocinitomicaceae bacterium]
MEYKLNSRNELQHPVIQPAAYGLETSLIALKDSSRTTDKYTQGWKVNPVISISGGFQMMDRQKSVGAVLAGGVAEWIRDDKWSASIGYAISIQHPPDYVVKMADSLRILPGMGYAVRTGDNTYYSHIPFGHIGYKAGKYFHFELGRGKHFWGDGYRSLILSDNSSPYPYFRITTKIWRIKYTNLFARMDDISGRRLYSNARIKYTALHGLSWNVSKTVNISLFEMVVWQDRDSLSRRHLDLSYLNPLIFYRPVEFAQGSSDNVLIGLGTKIKAMKNLQVYAQVVIDEFLLSEIQEARGWWGNKFGGQLGIKAFDIITRGLSFQSEVNA